MGLTDRISELFAPLSRAAVVPPPLPGMDNLWPFVNFAGNTYPFALNQTMPSQQQEEIDASFEAYVRYAYKSDGIIFACMEAHRRLFDQARFQWQRINGGTPGDLFGTADLGILEHPWQNAVTSDLLARAIQDADLAGNAYFVRRPGNIIKRLRPSWVGILLGSESDANVTSVDIDADVIGYAYYPGGKFGPRSKPVILMPEEVAHFAPIPDPEANFRGMSPITPIVREIMGDKAATDHKLKFFENGATPNLVVKRSDNIDKTVFGEWVRMMEEGHTGVANAYKTLYLSAGADATVVGKDLQQVEFKLTQGAGETRIAAAFGIPPIIVGLSEGLAAATYSNYGQARRAYADLWARDAWSSFCASMETIVPPPANARLWYDAGHIPFLQEDQKDAVDIFQARMTAAEIGIRSGWKADDVIKAATALDINLLLGKHTGLFSVQLQAPGSTKMPVGEAPGETPVAGGGTAPETPKPGVAKPLGPVGTPSNPGNGKAPAKPA